jgi:CHAT domain-containing protein
LTDDDVKLAPEQISPGEVRSKPRSTWPAAAHPFEHPYFWAGFILMGDPS